MEGRAIARPNAQQQETRHRDQDASMEGRAIARPNTSIRLSPETEERIASMEGRAIARPNWRLSKKQGFEPW